MGRVLRAEICGWSDQCFLGESAHRSYSDIPVQSVKSSDEFMHRQCESLLTSSGQSEPMCQLLQEIDIYIYIYSAIYIL